MSYDVLGGRGGLELAQVREGVEFPDRLCPTWSHTAFPCSGPVSVGVPIVVLELQLYVNSKFGFLASSLLSDE